MANPAGVLRRLGALAYDLLIVTALVIVATVPVLIVTRGEPVAAGALWYQLYLGVVIAGYFILFWWRRGQTLGMVAWQLVIRDRSGRPVTLAQATLHALTAPLSWLPAGIGLLWILLDSERRAWHDRLSGTQLIYTGRSADTR